MFNYPAKLMDISIILQHYKEHQCREGRDRGSRLRTYDDKEVNIITVNFLSSNSPRNVDGKMNKKRR